MQQIALNQATAALRRLPVYLVDATDGTTPETGITFAAGDIKISKNGAAEGNHAGTVTELAGGLYYYEAASGEVDTAGFLTARFTKTGVRTFVAAVQVATAGGSAPTATEIADAILTRDWTAVSGAAARSVLNALRFLRNKWSVAGGTLTVTAEDDTTTAWTATLTANTGAAPETDSARARRCVRQQVRLRLPPALRGRGRASETARRRPH